MAKLNLITATDVLILFFNKVILFYSFLSNLNLLIFFLAHRTLHFIVVLVLVDGKGNRTLAGSRTHVTIQLPEGDKLADKVNWVRLK